MQDNDLKDEVKELKDRIEQLENTLKNKDFLEDRFTGIKVFKYPVQFKAKVTDASGTTVIN